MVDFLQSFGLAPYEWVIAVICGMLIGMAKTGLSGVSMAVVPLFAMIFGARPSTGMLLPILIMADVYAVSYYTKHTSWYHVLRLMPWALGGVGIAAVVGRLISDEVFTLLLAAIIILGTILLIANDLRKSKTVPNHWWFSGIMGTAGGFTTMIGNAAGPIMSLYMLSMRLPKNVFIGTGAWYFFIVNVLKMPLHIFLWKTITLRTFLFDLLLLPAIALGAFAGVKIVKLIPERLYRLLIIATTLAAAVLLFFR